MSYRKFIVPAVLAVAVLALGTIAFAHGMGHRGRGRCMKMLQLTPQQQQSARAIFKDAREQAKAVLTPAQQAQVKAHFAARRQARGGHGMAALNLTDAQKAQMQAIRKDAHARAQTIRKDTTLSAEAKQTQLTALFTDTRSKIAAVLTPDQQAQLKAHRAQMQADRQAFKDSLKLTDAQQAQLKSIREKALTQFRALLTPDQQTKLDACRARCKTEHEQMTK